MLCVLIYDIEMESIVASFVLLAIFDTIEHRHGVVKCAVRGIRANKGYVSIFETDH